VIGKKGKAPRDAADLTDLRRRLRVAEDTLRALRTGDVDALVVTRAGDQQVVTLQDADLPYRILLEQMYAGAVTLTPDGVVVYCNRRFGDLVHLPVARIAGAELSRLVAPASRAAIQTLLTQAHGAETRGEVEFRGARDSPVAVEVTFAPLRLTGSERVSGVIGIVVDVSERKRHEALRTRLIEQVMTAQDQERARVARELHDETGQSLTALLVGLRAVEQARSVPEAIAIAQRLREMAAGTLRDVGRLARGLHPSVLDHLGLAVAATRLVQEFARQHGIAEDTRVEGLDAGPPVPLLESTIYRVLQEALTNVAKHARASRISVLLVRTDHVVELQVRDDGVGFDPTSRTGAPTANGGLGLQGMRERATLLGGALTIESSRGHGAVITARFPVRRPW